MTRTYRYVRIETVDEWLAIGWRRSKALEGTHHGSWSVLIWREGWE